VVEEGILKSTSTYSLRDFTLLCLHVGLFQQSLRWLWWQEIFSNKYFAFGDRGSSVVKVLCYKSEGRWFYLSWCQWIFYWRKFLPIALWPWGRLSLQQKWVPGVFPVPLSRNLGTLNSWNPLGHSRPVTRLLCLFYFAFIKTYLLTYYSMERRLSWEANRFSASQEIPHMFIKI